MNKDELQTFSDAVSAAWAPLSTELIDTIRSRVTRLLSAPATDRWLEALHDEAPETRELYRDPVHGFLLLAHTEQAGMYRPPHDHGRGWAIYAVERGEQEMRTYRRVHDLRGNAVLVKRESYVLRPGDVRVFLQGDIHDTLCKAGPLTLFRFTSRDFKNEEVTRYPAPGVMR
jgi:hypothetical protein